MHNDFLSQLPKSYLKYVNALHERWEVPGWGDRGLAVVLRYAMDREIFAKEQYLLWLRNPKIWGRGSVNLHWVRPHTASFQEKLEGKVYDRQLDPTPEEYGVVKAMIEQEIDEEGQCILNNKKLLDASLGDPYEILRLPDNATPRQVYSAYRICSLLCGRWLADVVRKIVVFEANQSDESDLNDLFELKVDRLILEQGLLHIELAHEQLKSEIGSEEF